MSIASEISRLQTAKANLKTQIEAKGVTVPSATKIDGYPSLVESIPTGGGGGGVDIPVFTAVWDEEGLTSFTCNKTFSECLALIDGDGTVTNHAAVYTEISTELGEETSRNTFSASGTTDYETYILYRANSEFGLPDIGQFLYQTDGTLSEVEQSTAAEDLFVLRNGDYYSDYESGKYYYFVHSAVPGSPSFSLTTKRPSSTSNSIQFSYIHGEPTSFVIVAEGSLSTGSSPYKTAAVVFDGTNVFGQYVTNVSNSEMTFSSTAFSKSYSPGGGGEFYDNGTLTITGVGTNFQQNVRYRLYYTYGGVSANIQTKQVQVGFGATSITFTGLTEEPIYWSCMFLGDIGTSSGYTRAHVVLCGEEGTIRDPKTIRGREMGSESIESQNWTASYSNGSLTITSQSASAGGYFHQPGYYQLTYAVAEPVIPSVEPLTVTENGSYSVDGKAYSPVVVNVPTGGGGTLNVGTATNTLSEASQTITFSSLSGTPKYWFLRATAQISSSGSTTIYYVTDAFYDGTNVKGNSFRIGSTRRIYNITSGISQSYSGGTLTVTAGSSTGATPGRFYGGSYELVYIY